MPEYLFDAKLFASLRITAPNVGAAKKQLATLLDCATANFGTDGTGKPVLAEVTLDAEDGAELVEVDGRAV